MSDAADADSKAQQGATQRNNKTSSPPSLMRNRRPRRELSHTQFAAVELVLRGLSDAQIANQLGVDRGSVYRWRMSPLFREELEHQRQALFEHSAAKLSAMIEPALEILNRQLTGDDPKTALRVAAILLRVATPSRLGQSPDASPRANQKSAADAHWEQVKAFIDSPLPVKMPWQKDAPVDEDEDAEADDSDA